MLRAGKPFGRSFGRSPTAAAILNILKIFFKPRHGQFHEFRLVNRVAHGMVTVGLAHELFGGACGLVEDFGVFKGDDGVCIAVKDKNVADCGNLVPEVEKQGIPVKGMNPGKIGRIIHIGVFDGEFRGHHTKLVDLSSFTFLWWAKKSNKRKPRPALRQFLTRRFPWRGQKFTL